MLCGQKFVKTYSQSISFETLVTVYKTTRPYTPANMVFPPVIPNISYPPAKRIFMKLIIESQLQL